MSPSIGTTFSPKRVAIALAAVTAASVIATFLFKVFWLALMSTFLAGALPFALLAIWLPRSRFGRFVRHAASVWQLRIFGISALFAYSVYANKWAGDVLNELFRVDSGHFGISTAVLAVLFAPFGLVYRQEVIGWLWIAFILVGVVITYALPLSLMVPGRAALGWKAWVGGVLYFFIGGFALAMSAHLATSFKSLATNFVIWADFNDKHLCTDDWTRQTNSVVFLGDQRVLVYFPDKPEGRRFSVQSCDYAGTF